MSTRLSWCVYSAHPAIFAVMTVYMKRDRVLRAEVDRRRMEVRRRVDWTTCAGNAPRRNLWSLMIINRNLRLSVRAPRHARDGVCRMRFKQFISENVVDIHRRTPGIIRSLNSRNNSSIDAVPCVVKKWIGQTFLLGEKSTDLQYTFNFGMQDICSKNSPVKLSLV